MRLSDLRPLSGVLVHVYMKTLSNGNTHPEATYPTLTYSPPAYLFLDHVPIYIHDDMLGLRCKCHQAQLLVVWCWKTGERVVVCGRKST
jgi:hypothetical protein